MRGFFPGLVLLAALPATAWGQAPAGTEFQVNSYTTGFQERPAVTSDAAGNFVVVWEGTYGQDGNSLGVFGRRFSAAGVPLGNEFQINSYTTNAQMRPAVASDANGNFVVVWQSYGQDGSFEGVFGQRFNAPGVPQGSEFQINVTTFGRQDAPRVASDANGNFVVVWGTGAIFARRFNASGIPQGSEFQVNSYATGFKLRAGVASDANGNFVVVWDTDFGLGDYDVFGRRFNASGAPQGSEFQVNTYTTGKQSRVAVSSDSSGNFVVAWQSAYGQDGNYEGVFGQRFDPSGASQASEFQVNSYTSVGQIRPALASDASGNFVVTWASVGQDGDWLGVFGQRFNASGAPQGSEFQVNSYTTNAQFYPAVAADSDGDFVVAWPSVGQDGDSWGIFGQRYGDIIFEDGFDSGDLSRWSSASTDGGNLSVSGAAAMAGTPFGLQAFVNDTNSLFVQDDTPNSEDRYRVRFYFDTNGFDPGEASSHFRTRIFIAFDPSGLRVITLVLKRKAGAYSIDGRVRRNDGTRVDTGFFPIDDGPHFIEFDWQRATAPGASNGSLQLWIDNASVATLSGIDNDLSPIDFARLGALAIKTGAAGTLYYDQFESRRQVFIGPE